MDNHWNIPHSNIFKNINFGSNVNTVINNLTKTLITVAVLALTGCATRPSAPPVVYVPQYQAMDSFKADCLYAKDQIEFLERKLIEYQQYHEYYPYTEADTKYYRQVKNALWALRTSCIVK
jgi:hypothetical protein